MITGALVMVILHFARLLSLVQVLTTAAKACTKSCASWITCHKCFPFDAHLSNIDMNSDYQY